MTNDSESSRSGASLDEDLHDAIFDGDCDDVEVLLRRGADAESLFLDHTPLWLAVRRGSRDIVSVLLRAGVDPWRPIIGNRSAGSVALTGPLADLFADLPGAPPVDPAWMRRQRRADEVVAHYATWSAYRAYGESYAFVAGVDEDTAIRRLGLDPADCPVTDGGGYRHALPGAGHEAYWLGTPPGGSGVALLNLVGTWPGSGHMWRPLSSPGPVVAVSTNVNVDTCIEIWRDGGNTRLFRSLQDPDDETTTEEWLCRFYDDSDDSATGGSMGLALGTLLTGVQVEEDWLFEAPKRLVVVPRT